MVFKSEFYGGSRLLSPLTDVIGLPIDQINFLVCQLVALGFAVPFRNYFSVEKVGAKTRHYIETCVGVFLTVFCFGYQVGHLLIQSLISYAFMAYGGKRWSHSLVFGFSMLYLSICHIYRQIYDYGGYTLDITGPLMIQTQKLTSLAFSLHDGRYKEKASLTPEQRNQSLAKLPNLLEYLSFMFYFHGVMVGPLTFYNDYISFIDGTSLTKPGGTSSTGKKPFDNVNKVVIRKLLVAAALCTGMMILPGLFFPPDKLNTPYFYRMNFVSKMFFILGVISCCRFKYYFAWVLSDAMNNAAGYGFTGYDDEGNPKWDLTDNIDIKGVELSTSLKNNIGSWNKTTNVWLRCVIYERAPKFQTFAVFLTSAFWHGFYPGYYIAFTSGAAMTIVARQVRRNIRPFFQTSELMKIIYDAITFTATRFVNCYVLFPFVVLEFYATISMYSSIYFHWHILTILGFQFFTFFPLAKKRSGDATTRPKTNSVGSGLAGDESANNPGGTDGSDHPTVSAAATTTAGQLVNRFAASQSKSVADSAINGVGAGGSDDSSVGAGIVLTSESLGRSLEDNLKSSKRE